MKIPKLEIPVNSQNDTAEAPPPQENRRPSSGLALNLLVLITFCTITVLLPVSVGAQLKAEQNNEKGEKIKSVFTAGALSAIFPGLGQFYVEDYGKGMLHLGLGVGSLTVATVGGLGTITGILSLDTEQTNKATNVFLVGMVAYGGTWVWSIIDATKTARKINREGKKKAVKISVSPVLLSRTVGTALVLRF